LSAATDAKVAECLDMAIKARLRANAALSRGDQGFWQVMEERWIRIAQTYRETERLSREFRRGAQTGGP